MSIHWPIIRRCLASPRRVAVIDDRRTVTRGQFLGAAFHVAAHLAPRSESKTIGLLLPTSAAFPIAALAGWILGKTVVPLNYLLKPEELRFVVEDCEADTVVTAQVMLDYLGHAADQALGGLAGQIKHLVRMDEIDFKSVPELRWPARAEASDLGVLLYTSGTTGKPKGVMLTHGNIASNIRQVLDWVDLDERDSVLGVLPQFHSFGMTVLTLLPLTAGCRAIYTARFMPAKLIRLMREHKPTLMVAIPSMYNALLHSKDAEAADFASFRYIASGGEPLPEAVTRGFLERFGVRICEGFGMTETGPATNWCRPDEYRLHSVGRPLPGVVQRIVDINTGRDVQPGAEGELRIAGPNVMQGYFRRPEETRAAFDEHGYLRSGDIARFDEDGHLYITGRLKEMMIVGGENVFPREIEEVLNKHPSVKDSGVVGMQDPVRGELPLAFVELKDEATFSEKDLLGWCRERLAGYKVPREVRRLDALPRNATGKVSRKELRGMVVGG